jgi:hypothetical protein
MVMFHCQLLSVEIPTLILEQRLTHLLMVRQDMQAVHMVDSMALGATEATEAPRKTMEELGDLEITITTVARKGTDAQMVPMAALALVETQGRLARQDLPVRRDLVDSLI